MSDVIQLFLMGRFGNQCLQWAFAKAYAEKHGLELQTQPWIGESIFEITPNAIITSGDMPRRCENTLVDGERNISYRSYSQQQRCLIYTKRDLQRWFKFRPEVAEKLTRFWQPHCAPMLVAHRRVGDMIGYGYVQVSKESYRRQAEKLGLAHRLQYITEEEPYICPDIPAEYAFVCDFWRLMHAPILLRGNSSFSWMAGALSDNVVYSPRIDGLAGGAEHECAFELGNHCRFANLSFVSDLLLAP